MNINNKYNTLKINSTLLVCSVVFLSVFIFYFLSGYLSHGYFITDEHDILKTQLLINEHGVFGAMFNWFEIELVQRNRIRFFYRTLLTLQTHLWGFNWSIWNITRMFSVLLCFFLFYKSFLKISSRVILSAVSSLFIIIGPQSLVFLRFGPAERYGIVLLGFTLFFLIRFLDKKKLVWLVFSLLSYFFSGFSKEPFILFGPALALVPSIYNYRIRSSRFRLLVSSTYLFAFFSFLVILFSFNSKPPGYAESESSLIISLISTILKNKIVLFNFLGVAILVGLTLVFGSFKELFWKLLLLVVFFLVISLSQIYLYAETNFQFGRYYLPFLVALPLTISFLNQKKIVELLSGQKKVFLYFGSILTIVLILIFNLFGTNTINKIKNIEKSKRLTTKIFSSISNYTTENDSILIVGDPGTNFESMSFGYTDYIKQVLGRYNIFYLPLEVDYENEQHLINLKNSFMKFAEGRSYASKDIDLYNFKYILVLNSTSWYKGRKFGDNKKAFQDILISQASESKHFLRLKFASMTSYVRHEGDFVDGLTPLYEEAPIYITRINETKVSYKELNNLQNWKIPKADYYSINGFVHKEVSAVYLGIDSSFVRCTFKTNTSKKGEHNSKFNCLFNNKLQDNISDHVFTPVLITKDSSSYWFLGKPYYQPRFSIN